MATGCKRSKSSVRFTQLDDRVMKDLSVTDMSHRQNKMQALVTSIYTTQANKQELLKKADMIYRDHVFVDIEDDRDYGLPLLGQQPMAQLFGEIGKFDNYSNPSLLDELKTNLLGERHAGKTVMSRKLNQKLSENIMRQMERQTTLKRAGGSEEDEEEPPAETDRAFKVNIPLEIEPRGTIMQTN